jgi:PhnB protein
MSMPDGSIGHAEVRIDDSIIMMGDTREETWKARPSSICPYVTDCDAANKRALEAGASSLMESKDQFYGDRSCGVKDPVENSILYKQDICCEQ